MYILYHNEKYSCTCRPGETMSYHGLPATFPAPVSGEIVLCADDDFVMRTDYAEDYLRQVFEDGVLTLTNAPEPMPEVNLETTLDERVTALEDALALTDETAIELYEAMMAQEEINTAQDDALIELYEMIGG